MKTIFSSLAHRVWVLLLLATMAGALTTSCSKDDTTVDYSATDDALIQKYLTTNNITTAVKQPSGLYYVPVVTNASAKLVTTGQVVSMLYTGQLLNGTVFDATSLRNNNPYNFIFGVNRLVTGIEQGIALMHKGDKATLLIPSGLAYGPSGAGNTVPANAVLRFDVEITDINPDFKVPDDNIIKKYLTDNSITTAQKQASGLYYVPGTVVPAGTPAAANKTVSVLYTGRFMDGTIFDASSRNGNQPISFVLGKGQVIPGWDEGIALMRKGETGQLLIPSALAYGPSGAGTTIAPNTVLRFEVEVTDVK
ncbi:MAG: FKBP-type peptidyl-prolyl cis-trans isomerase [Hymenobacter sp.]|nr:MAG: FKBP-type peptidyl-prolyl cis-trans isomerase [Hymenobacter sp.]